LGTLLLAHYQGKAIAGAVFLHFGQRAIYKYGASDRRCQHLRANNLVFREGIRSMCAKGCRILSFGRTDIEHEGLRQFKLSWDAKETRLQYVRFNVKSNAWLSGQKSRIPSWERMISRMPLPILRAVGNIAYRHVG
jgi:lipid II:glycine glycyltransferase (peptidoglycan interpeptide bridge formation enzyme)